MHFSSVPIDLRDQLAEVPVQRRWWATCGTLGEPTEDGRGICHSCKFSGAGPIPLRRDSDVIGRVLFAGISDDVNDDPTDPHVIRQIIMAGDVAADHAATALDGRFPELDLGSVEYELDPSGTEMWITSASFSALTAGIHPAFSGVEFVPGVPAWWNWLPRR